jgi:hypothetical protein
MTDVVTMLRKIESLRPGDPMPDEWGPGDWGTPLSKLCGEAADEIERLRADKQVVIHYEMPASTFWFMHTPETVEWSVANDPLDWSIPSDNGSTAIEPWGSPYAMNPENWK